MNKKDYNNLAKELFETQAKQWPLMAQNFDNLKKVRTKDIVFDSYTFRVQFNPARITSTSAKVDKTAIEKRPCFLCPQNRPDEQLSIDFEDDYSILVNPFPIFPYHLTIAHKKHVGQFILEHFLAMLKLAKALPHFTILYNGPRSGASAPDHFHFQAGNRGFMPLDSEYAFLKKKFGSFLQINGCEAWKIDDGIRKFFILESEEAMPLGESFKFLCEKMLSVKKTEDEPDMNILCLYENNKWVVQMFPRQKHRPWQYFDQGEDNILFSPGAADMGGILTTPLEKDFLKIDKGSLIDMMQQIVIKEDLFSKIDF